MKDLDNKKYWIWLSYMKEINYNVKRKLLEKYKEPKYIYTAKYEELKKIQGIGEKTAEKILEFRYNNSIEKIYKHMKYMIENKIGIITINDNRYPKLLKEIYDPPISLYVKGNVNILNGNSIAIVGCRDATEYGKKAAKYFSYNLARKEVNIISGLARGIDSYAHEATLDTAGKTIAVVGNGLDIIYPKENIELERKILENNGAIISEYPIGTKPNKRNFPARNRIISGMSNGVLVIEAKKKSGTLITVDFALEQGKEVYVVPGNINSPNSIGTNELIKQGAKMVTNYEDLI